MIRTSDGKQRCVSLNLLQWFMVGIVGLLTSCEKVEWPPIRASSQPKPQPALSSLVRIDTPQTEGLNGLITELHNGTTQVKALLAILTDEVEQVTFHYQNIQGKTRTSLANRIHTFPSGLSIFMPHDAKDLISIHLDPQLGLARMKHQVQHLMFRKTSIHELDIKAQRIREQLNRLSKRNDSNHNEFHSHLSLLHADLLTTESRIHSLPFYYAPLDTPLLGQIRSNAKGSAVAFWNGSRWVLPFQEFESHPRDYQKVLTKLAASTQPPEWIPHVPTSTLVADQIPITKTPHHILPLQNQESFLIQYAESPWWQIYHAKTKTTSDLPLPLDKHVLLCPQGDLVHLIHAEKGTIQRYRMQDFQPSSGRRKLPFKGKTLSACTPLNQEDAPLLVATETGLLILDRVRYTAIQTLGLDEINSLLETLQTPDTRIQLQCSPDGSFYQILLDSPRSDRSSKPWHGVTLYRSEGNIFKVLSSPIAPKSSSKLKHSLGQINSYSLSPESPILELLETHSPPHHELNFALKENAYSNLHLQHLRLKYPQTFISQATSSAIPITLFDLSKRLILQSWEGKLFQFEIPEHADQRALPDANEPQKIQAYSRYKQKLPEGSLHWFVTNIKGPWFKEELDDDRYLHFDPEILPEQPHAYLYWQQPRERIRIKQFYFSEREKESRSEFLSVFEPSRFRGRKYPITANLKRAPTHQNIIYGGSDQYVLIQEAPHQLSIHQNLSGARLYQMTIPEATMNVAADTTFLYLWSQGSSGIVQCYDLNTGNLLSHLSVKHLIQLLTHSHSNTPPVFVIKNKGHMELMTLDSERRALAPLSIPKELQKELSQVSPDSIKLSAPHFLKVESVWKISEQQKITHSPQQECLEDTYGNHIVLPQKTNFKFSPHERLISDSFGNYFIIADASHDLDEDEVRRFKLRAVHQPEVNLMELYLAHPEDTPWFLGFSSLVPSVFYSTHEPVIRLGEFPFEKNLRIVSPKRVDPDKKTP